MKRSLILRELRSYLDGKGFLEVDTPILTPFEIGASRPPLHHPPQHAGHGHGAAH